MEPLLDGEDHNPGTQNNVEYVVCIPYFYHHKKMYITYKSFTTGYFWLGVGLLIFVARNIYATKFKKM